MARINNEYEPNVIIHNKNFIEVSAVYNNHFIRRFYAGMSDKKAIKQFDKDIKTGKI